MSQAGVKLHYTGHRIAGPNMTSLHAVNEARIAAAIAAAIGQLAPSAAYGSLAAGADILFAEAILDYGAKLNVFLPFDTRRFKTVSVWPAGRRWVARFEHVLAAASHVAILQGRFTAAASFTACSAAAMRAAREDAGQDGQALQLALWNGRAARGLAGTAADVAAWQALGLRTKVINPDNAQLHQD